MYDAMIRTLDPLAHAAFPHWLDIVARSSVLLSLAALFAFAARRRSAAQRHLLWTLAVSATLAMPALSRVAPRVEVPLPVEGLVAPVVLTGPAVSTRSVGPPAVAPLSTVSTGAASPLSTEAVATPSTGAAAPSTERVGPAPSLPIEADVGAGAVTKAPASENVTPSASATAQPWRGQGPAGWMAMWLVTWSIGVFALLGLQLRGVVRLAWLARQAPRIAEGPLFAETRRIARRIGLRRTPVLLRAERGSVPMTWGLLRTYLVLPEGAESWEPRSREAVLLHELGHVHRRDYLAQVTADLTCALHWFNPLVWYAAHRMRVEREHACDDLVVTAGHEPSRYANELVRLARDFRPGSTAAAALAFARPNRLRDRLVALLDQTRSRRPLTRRRVAVLGVAGLGAASVLAGLAPRETLANAEATPPDGLPAVREMAEPAHQAFANHVVPLDLLIPATTSAVQEATVLCGPADGEARRRMTQTNDESRTIEAEYGDCRSSVRIEGDLTFTRDFAAIASMSSGSLVRFEVRRRDDERRLEARPGSGGTPEYSWWVDGRSAAFDAAARAWLENALLDLFRSSSYMARERTAWILSQEGPDGVLAEVERLFSDHAQATYLAVLLQDGDLSPQHVRRSVEFAGREVESDHALGEVLMAAADRYPFDAATRTTFLQAATSIESDHTQGEIFRTALSRDDLSQSDLELLLRTAAGSIESDHTLGEVLRSLASRYPLEPGLRDPFLEAASTIDSDHTAGEVYAVLLEQGGLRTGELAAILDASTSIGSDHTLGELLRSAAERHDLSNPELLGAFLRAAAEIESDHTLSVTLIELARMGGIGERGQIELLETARGIGSDHSLAEFLTEFADEYPVRGEVRDAFMRTLDGVGSRHSRERVLSALEGRR